MNTATNIEKKDIFATFTNDIIAHLEQGVGNWTMPWQGRASGMPKNASTQACYRGVNVLILWGTAARRGYATHHWATYQQWKELGAQVKQGEKGTAIVFWKFLDEGESDTAGEAAETQGGEAQGGQGTGRRRVAMARTYHVFNAEQVSGYELPELKPAPELVGGRIVQADTFFEQVGATIRVGGFSAHYALKTDEIAMPRFEAFVSPESYYSTLAHEVTHWSGAKHRLNRDLSGRFGDESYAAEELIAELGAAFLCGILGLSSEPRKDHAKYIQSWLSILKNDKRAVVTAASHAQKAADYICGLVEAAAVAA